MKNRRLLLVVSLVGVAAVAWPAHGNNRIPNIENPQQDDRPAEQANKNIQVLKGLPNNHLLTVMHFMRTSLGVRCDYCHVAENGKYWMDDKPPKQVARRMIEMV